ncbi:MAG: pyruvate dehydrogenase complex E1 component subunit beta [Candidatus Tectomicrobia bacterium]|uniref:Pyruvate dehydrogenase complex E1 component subunit beta n=1 Tax=Tectimicrobiota bacterium TaxID=2528274 RepID=A0A932GNC6_UNCTE|nr:pyruvate dehydrogenase complex E1 component subunit beta [Candidatus Tectomicrobia bacterium]
MAVVTYREALNQALREEMERDPNVFIVGEEVGYYQGAYKVTQGLLDQFGEWRVRDTPIAEEVIAGIGIGAALVGLRPIAEMMTFNFSLLALDQIVNNAAKIRYMSGGQFKVPVVFRGPGGAAHQLGAQHSQSLESYYAYVPGLKVVLPATPKDAKGLLKSAIRDDDPVVFIESEVLYGTRGEVPEGEYTIPLGQAEVKRPGKDVTLIAHSKTVLLALQVAESLAAEGIEAEVVDPRTLRPLDSDLLLESVRKTHRCVIVEEGWPFCGIGAQIATTLYSEAFDTLDAPIERVTSADVPMPYAKPLEAAVVPDTKRVRAAIDKVLYRQ